MVVENFIRDAEPTARLMRFSTATNGQRASADNLVAGITCRYSNEFDSIAKAGQLCDNPGRTDIAIVRGRPERNHTHFFALREHSRRANE